jgi:hypothetical protein
MKQRIDLPVSDTSLVQYGMKSDLETKLVNYIKANPLKKIRKIIFYGRYGNSFKELRYVYGNGILTEESTAVQILWNEWLTGNK